LHKVERASGPAHSLHHAGSMAMGKLVVGPQGGAQLLDVQCQWGIQAQVWGQFAGPSR